RHPRPSSAVTACGGPVWPLRGSVRPLGRDEGATRVPMTTGEHHATDEGSHHGADEAPHTGQTGRAPRSLHRNAGELAQRRYRTEVRSTLGGHPLPRRRG